MPAIPTIVVDAMRLQALLIAVSVASGCVDADKAEWGPDPSGKQDLNRDRDRGPIAFGASLDATLASGTRHRYSFEGRAGARITADMTSGNRRLDPFMAIVLPNGDLVTEADWDDGGLGLDSRIATFTLPTTGHYLLVAMAFHDIGGGDYGLHLGCLDASCEPPNESACPPVETLIGGGLAGPGQFPATAGLLVGSAGATAPTHLTCTMTKVGDRTFLLAAHCMFPGGVQDGTAMVRAELDVGATIGVLGGVEQRGPVTSTTVVAHRIHPSWFQAITTTNEGGKFIATDGDAALLIVADATPDIAIAKVDTRPVARCAPVTMQGYGCTSFGGGATTGPLRFLEARIEATIGSMNYISSGFTNSSMDGSICPGDSGGALYDPNLRIVGINSRFASGQLLGAQIEPNQSYFTRLDDAGPQKMATWLDEQMRPLGP